MLLLLLLRVRFITSTICLLALPAVSPLRPMTSALRSCVVSSLASSRRTFVASCQSTVRMRSIWMDKHVEELDAVEKSLTACARASLSPGVDPVATYSDLATILPVLNASVLPRLSSMLSSPLIPFNDASAALSMSSRIQADVDLSQCVWSGPGLDWCDPSTSPSALAHNTVTLAIVDRLGEPVRGIDESDISLSLTHGCLAGAVSRTNASQLQFSYTVPADINNRDITLSCSVFGHWMSPVSIEVGGSIHGELLCSITIPSSTGNVGLACSSDGALLAVSNFETKRVCVLTTDPATVLYTFGGPGDLPGQFNEPCKLCFAPNGNILVCEDINQRVQEVTISGVHVRFIGADILVGDVWAVDVSPSGDRLVVGVFNDPLDTTDQILLFDFVTGEFLHSFASVGSAPGKVSGVVSVRFCPLIDHIMVVEQDNNRMSVFTEAGVFAREIRKPDGEDEHGLKWPRDVAFPPNGDTLVADYGVHRVCAFTDGEFKWSFGQEVGMKYPSAIALGPGPRLYVLQAHADTILVFK